MSSMGMSNAEIALKVLLDDVSDKESASPSQTTVVGFLSKSKTRAQECG